MLWCDLSRVAWVFGPAVVGPIEDITPTYLTRGVLEILRECDYLANQILAENGMFFFCAVWKRYFGGVLTLWPHPLQMPSTV